MLKIVDGNAFVLCSKGTWKTFLFQHNEGYIKNEKIEIIFINNYLPVKKRKKYIIIEKIAYAYDSIFTLYQNKVIKLSNKYKNKL